jgi:hypothetical protein
MRPAREPTRLLAFLGGTFLIVFAWSVVRPKDRTVWWLEVLPALIGAIVLLATYWCFRLTPVAVAARAHLGASAGAARGRTFLGPSRDGPCMIYDCSYGECPGGFSSSTYSEGGPNNEPIPMWR